jgi:hypothetical protein
MGARWKITDGGKRLASIMTIAGISLSLQFKGIISGEPISPQSANSKKAFIDNCRENYQPWMLMGFPLSVLFFSGRPMDMYKPHLFVLIR